MCFEFENLFFSLVDSKTEIKTKSKFHLKIVGEFILLKNKLLRIFRDTIYLKLRNILISIYKKAKNDNR